MTNTQEGIEIIASSMDDYHGIAYETWPKRMIEYYIA